MDQLTAFTANLSEFSLQSTEGSSFCKWQSNSCSFHTVCTIATRVEQIGFLLKSNYKLLNLASMSLTSSVYSFLRGVPAVT